MDRTIAAFRGACMGSLRDGTAELALKKMEDYRDPVT